MKMIVNGLTDKNHGWIKSYLSTGRQFIQINEKEKERLETINCGIPQGSILGPFLFLLHVFVFVFVFLIYFAMIKEIKILQTILV